MGTLAFEIGDVLRTLRHDRGYAATVVLTLALTIGGATAVFSIVNGVLLKPLAYSESHRLVSVKEIWRQLADRIPVLEVNAQHFEYWRKHARTFESLAQYIVLPANLTGAGEAAQVLVAHASGSFFTVLRVEAGLGRTLSPDDEPSDRPEVAVITDAAWRQRFGSDPGIVGGPLVLDGKPHTIVGVLRSDFRMPAGQLAAMPDAFVPIHMDAERVGWEGDHNNDAIGRLRDGITLEQARAELDVLQAQVSAIASKEAGQPVTLASVVAPLTETIVGKARRGLLLLLGAIGAVLLIACSNLASLSLTRAVGRLRDAAIRCALGAGRARLVAHAVIEQLVLAVAGGALGLLVAWAALRLFVRTAPVDLPRVDEVALDGRVMVFAAAVSIFVGLVVAVLPAWRTAWTAIEQALRATSLSTTADRAGTRVRNVLIAAQVALSMTLLVVTGLLGMSFVRLMNVDRGFVAERVLLVPLSMPADRYATEASQLTVYDRLLGAVRALPGVLAVTTISATPLAGQSQVNAVAPEDSVLPRSAQPSANFRFVAPDFFRTLGITIIQGRAFAEDEGRYRGTMPALVSKPTAKRLWPGADAIGKRFSRGIPGERGFEVVGITADTKLTSLDQPPPLMVYVPYWWRSRPSLSLLIRTASDPAGLMPGVRRAVRELDPDIAIGNARPLERVVEDSVAARRYQMQLFVAFGILALFIATLGVYAVTSYAVSRRRREMNIRVALGAQARQVFAMIMLQGSRPIAAGIGAGTAGALALGGLVASLLFEVRPRDPAVILGVIAVVGGVGVLACFVAVRQGLVIDPAAALRDE